jgi:hypothetical protein
MPDFPTAAASGCQTQTPFSDTNNMVSAVFALFGLTSQAIVTSSQVGTVRQEVKKNSVLFCQI